MSYIIKPHLINRCCNSKVFNYVNCIPRIFQHEKSTIKVITSLQIRYGSDVKTGINSRTSKDHLQLLYHGPLANQIKYIKGFSIFTSIASLAGQTYIIPKTWETGNLYTTIFAITFFGFFTFITPLLLHVLTNRYTLDLYYDKNRKVYIASTYTIFVTKREIEFTADDVTKPEVLQMLTTCFVKGIPIFFEYNQFTDPEHYAHILGYDKPMDFQVSPQQTFASINSVKTTLDDDKKIDNSKPK